MDEWQVDLIDCNLPRLCELTDCNASLISLLHEHLSSEEKSELKGIPNKIGKAERFYEIMKSKDEGFDALITAFKSKYVKGFGTAKILEEGKVAWENAKKAAEVPKPVETPKLLENVKQLQEVPKPELDHSSSIDANPIPPSEDKVDFMVNTKPLPVIVKKPDKKLLFDDDHYKLHGNEKGFALIINITEFINSSYNRHGAQEDTNYMYELWSQLGYQVTKFEGRITRDDLIEKLEVFKKNFTEFEGASCVVFIGSHGLFSKIETSDHHSINLYSEVIYKFDSVRCPELKGKPKLFLIQACQDFRTGTDSVPDRTEADRMLDAPIDDTMVCFSTIPGRPSNRDKYLGTWFTYCLTKVFMEHAHRLPVYDLLKKTQEAMRNIDGEPKPGEQGQLCTPVDLGLRKFYFNLDPE